jgi:hypothetical protein
MCHDLVWIRGSLNIVVKCVYARVQVECYLVHPLIRNIHHMSKVVGCAK